MAARIYQPAKTATSSGRAKTRWWVVEFEPRSRPEAERLVGWVGSPDTEQQVTLRFSSREAAIQYCQRRGIPFELEEPHVRAIRPKSYAANFLRRV